MKRYNLIYIVVLLLTTGCSQVNHNQHTTQLVNMSENDVCCDKQKLISYIKLKEIEYSMPSGLLQSIIFIESSYLPFTLNIDAKPYRFKNKYDAIRVAKQAARRRKQIDIGVCQINYNVHGRNFKSIEQMINPFDNIDYAAKLLSNLASVKRSWKLAIQHYHGSNNKVNNIRYMNKVLKYRNTIIQIN